MNVGSLHHKKYGDAILESRKCSKRRQKVTKSGKSKDPQNKEDYKCLKVRKKETTTAKKVYEEWGKGSTTLEEKKYIFQNS